MSRSGDRYVAGTRDRFSRPRSTKNWYRCLCGRWWGKNKSCMCSCGAPPRPTRKQALDGQRSYRAHLLKMPWHTPEWVQRHMFGDR